MSTIIYHKRKRDNFKLICVLIVCIIATIVGVKHNVPGVVLLGIIGIIMSIIGLNQKDKQAIASVTLVRDSANTIV